MHRASNGARAGARSLPRTGVAVLSLSLCLMCGAARAEPVALAELERRAVERYAALGGSAFKVRAAAAQVREAQAAFRPKIGLSVDANAQPGRILLELPANPDAGIEEGFYVQGVRSPQDVKKGEKGRAFRDAIMPRPRVGAGVQLDAYLYDFGRTEAAVRAGRARQRAAETDAELSRAEVVAEVRSSYLAWLSAHELHVLAATATGDAVRRSERVNALIQEGVRARTELAPIEADRMLSELERERADGELAEARLALEHAVGEALAETAEPDIELLARPFPPAPTRGAHPASQILSHQHAALEANALLQRRQRLPLLSTSIAAGVYGQLTQRPKEGDSSELDYKITPFPAYSLGLALTVPLWDGGGAKAAVEVAEANAAELELRLESLERDRLQAYERSRLAAEHAERRRAIAQQLLEVCKVRVADTEAGYELGAMPFDQVQQARALLRRAETELVLAKVARAEAVLRVTSDR